MKNPQRFDMKSGAQDEIEGIAKKLSGQVKETTGKALGNPGLEIRGHREKLEGVIQDEVGKIKRAFGE